MSAREWAWIILMIILGLFVWTSCMTPSKATNYLKDKNLLAGVCAAEFPVHDSVIVHDSIHFDTLYEPGPQVMARDTIIVAGQPIPFYNECPPAKVIRKTVWKDSVIYRKDVAEQAVSKQQIADLTVVNKDLVRQRDEYKASSEKNAALAKRNGRQRTVTWILLVVGFVGGFILKMKKIF